MQLRKITYGYLYFGSEQVPQLLKCTNGLMKDEVSSNNKLKVKLTFSLPVFT